MTKIECAIVMAHTGTCMLQGDDIKWFYRYLNKLFGRLVYTHEIPALADEIKQRSKADFLELCKGAE